MSQPPYLFVIDTEQYAGDFERELGAWCTGQIGQCGVGDREAADFAALFPNELKGFIDAVEQFDDKASGCLRPVKLVETPGWLNNGLGYHYRDDPSEYPEALARLRASSLDYSQAQLQLVERRLAERDFESTPTGWTQAACERTRDSILSRRAELDALTVPPRYPAALSVGIGFTRKPTPAQIDRMKARAQSYAEAKGLTITGFRLISHRTKTSDQIC